MCIYVHSEPLRSFYIKSLQIEAIVCESRKFIFAFFVDFLLAFVFVFMHGCVSVCVCMCVCVCAYVRVHGVISVGVCMCIVFSCPTFAINYREIFIHIIKLSTLHQYHNTLQNRHAQKINYLQFICKTHSNDMHYVCSKRKIRLPVTTPIIIYYVKPAGNKHTIFFLPDNYKTYNK